MSGPFRDIIRERNGMTAARASLADFEASRPTFTDRDWAVWTGKLAATVEDLLAIVENLQTVADLTGGAA